MSIVIKDADGNNVTLASKVVDGEHCPIQCETPNGKIDNYLSKFAVDLDDSDNEHANKDYSVTPGTFTLKPPAGTVYYVTRLIPFIEDGGTFDSGSYGNGITLTNGIVIKVKQGATDKILLTNTQPIKTNTHWSKFCFDTDHSNYGAGNETLSARWTFSKGGTYIKLDGDLDEKIEVQLTDDFSDLVDQTFLFQGYSE